MSSLDIIHCFVKSMCEMDLLQLVQNPGPLEGGSIKDSCGLVPRGCVQVESRKEPRLLSQALVEGPFGGDRRAEPA